MTALDVGEKLLVTGGAGFIGSALCRSLVGEGRVVMNFDALTYAGSLSSLCEIEAAPNYRFVRGDIRDLALLERVFSDFQPDAVLHLAAESHVDRSIDAPAAFVDTNVVGTQNLLDAARSYWEGLDEQRGSRFRFLHVSTDEVFGSLGADGLFDEDSPYNPRSPYAATKAGADHLVGAWAHTYGLPVVRSNCSNNYGPYQFPEKFIPRMILAALSGRPLTVYGDGGHVRDWLYVDDHVAALKLILSQGRVGETYLVGGRSERRNIDVANSILEIVARLAPQTPASIVEFVEDRPGHDRRYGLDCSKIEAELGWRRSISFEQGLESTVAWYIERSDWWRPILEKSYSGERLGMAGAQ